MECGRTGSSRLRRYPEALQTTTRPARPAASPSAQVTFPWVLALLLAGACGSPDKEDNQPPVARLRTPAVGNARLPVTLDATRSADPDGTVVRFRYLFGDGAPEVTLAESSYRHVFPGAGRYTFRLTVEDDQGAASSVEREIVLVDNFTPPYCTTTAECSAAQTCEDDGVCWEDTP